MKAELSPSRTSPPDAEEKSTAWNVLPPSEVLGPDGKGKEIKEVEIQEKEEQERREKREYKEWKKEKRDEASRDNKTWGEPVVNWHEFELFLKYGRRWKERVRLRNMRSRCLGEWQRKMKRPKWLENKLEAERRYQSHSTAAKADSTTTKEARQIRTQDIPTHRANIVTSACGV